MVAAVVVAAVLGVAAVVRSPDRSGAPPRGGAAAPPVLHVAGSGGAVADVEPRDQVPGTALRLAGSLPQGPARADAFRLRSPSTSELRRLATALGLDASPRRVRAGWVAESGEQRLAVRSADGSWSFGPRDCVAPPVPDDGAVPACALAQRVAPPEATVRAAARRVFAALGLRDAPVRVSGATATAQPRVDARPTTGLATAVTVSSSGITAANGRLGRPVRLGSYPLVSAGTAYRSLLARPRILAEVCRLAPDGHSCVPPAPTTVTGATLGLAFEPAKEGPVLVPAWLFTVRGSDDPLVVVALQPRFLKPYPGWRPGLPPRGSSGGQVGSCARSGPAPVIARCRVAPESAR
jgi:hypothetical protein